MADPWAAFPKADATPAQNGAWDAFPVEKAAPVEAAPMSMGDTAKDVAKSTGTGLVKGAIGIGGLVGDLSDLGAKGIDKATEFVSNKLGIDYQAPDRSKSILNSIPTSRSIQDAVEAKTGKFYEPQSGAGKVAETIGEFAPGALMGGGSVASNLLRYAVLPGAASEAAGYATKGTAYEPYARAAAGIAGGLVNPTRAITPLPVSDARKAMIDTLHNEGVTSLTAGQRTGNEALRYMESASASAPGAGHKASDIQREGQRQFTEAAVRRAGAGPDASPEVLGANQRRLGNEFERLSQKTTLNSDAQFANDMGDVLNRYDRLLEAQQKPVVNAIVDDLVDRISKNGGYLPGTDYQAIRSDIRRVTQGDQSLKGQALKDIRGAMDRMMERSLAPEDVAAWKAAQREYAAQKVLEKAASRAGEVTAEGQITPANLRNTVSAENRGAYARGEGQFADLSRAGVGIMSPLPNSGTAPRQNAFNLLNQATLGMIPAAKGRILMSDPVQNYLANQLMSGAQLPVNPTAQSLLLIQMLQRGAAANQPAIQAQ